MAKAKVELPDGRIATIEIPDGMSMEEAQAELETMYDTTPEAFGAPAQAPAPEAAPQAAPAPTPAAAESGSWMDNVPHLQIPRGMLTGQADNPMAAYGAGLREAGGGMVRGARQLFNKLTGDDAELAELNQQEEAARADWEQRSAEHPIAGGAGKLVGNVGAPLAAAAAVPTAAGAGVAGGLGLLLRTGLGAASGATAGAAQPLTGQEEQGGERGINAALGGTIGGVVPGLGAMVRKGRNALSKVDADDALTDFAKRQLGATHEKGASGAYAKVNEAIEGKYKALREKFSQQYDAIEKAPTPPVKLETTARLGDEVLSLPEEVSAGLSPTARRVAKSLQKGATKTSSIVDASGKPIQDARDVSFADVRETIRELRGAKRGLPYTDNGIQQSKRIDSLIKNLDDDLANWGAKNPEAGQVLAKAKELDTEYAKQVAPFSSKDSAIGSYRKPGKQDEKNFNKRFLKDDSGSATGELLERVPEAKDATREAYGHQLLINRGPTTKARALDGGTLSEKLLSKDEREYLKKVADSVRSTKGSGAMLSPTLENILRRSGVGKVETMLHGVEKYGAKPSKGTIMGDMLRAYTAGQFATEE